ncbi:fucose-specific lectin FleA [Aspergillus ibericus CBS 121593]|uniref:Fucose-specific lectin n=1 Tax=Aspergillus ibericus CBS 121593 TaxID=1448316 RepID=A0A395GYC6_9EURO|nr:hypothetical protein BO80DRAFT_465526 [Aspergillus ibericus CBS 121593]RAL00075.1 hypothetical protein BO80DRAFT_465526 [Aspergillus ibericus CBS 121593]
MMTASDPPENTIAQVSVPEEGKTYYLCQSGEDLTEEEHSDDSSGIESPVGSARAGTNATYLVRKDAQREIYCLDEENYLQAYAFDEDSWEWQPGTLDGLRILVASNTHLAAISTEDGFDRVFFQLPEGQLGMIARRDGQGWQKSSLPPTTPADGASLFALGVEDGVRLFYSHKDCSIHQLAWDGRDWADSEVPQTGGILQKSHIFAQQQGSGINIQFCDEDARVYVLKDGNLSRLGFVFQGRLKKDKDAQSDRWPQELESSVKWKGLK